MHDWSRRAVTKLDLPGSGVSWSIDIEQQGEFYMTCFEQFNEVDGKRMICTEQLLDKEDLIKLRENINFMIGDAS